ncbi:MAG: HD domain-containing phosphohydrolase [Nanobdellota archaeon]
MNNILIVDNDRHSQSALENLLDGYSLTFAKSTKQASNIIKEGSIDITLLSTGVKDSIQFVHNSITSGHYPDFIIMGDNDGWATAQAFRHGASDVITNPLANGYLRKRIDEIARLKDTGYDNHRILKNYERMMNNKLPYVLPHQETARDHLRGLWDVVGIQLYEEYYGTINEDLERFELLEASSFHDIGKLAIPERIRNKTGRLTAKEKEKVREHPTVGARMMRALKGYERAADIIQDHHEYYDGSGYPEGKCGKEIHPGARLLCPVETFLGYTHYKPYRGEGMPYVDAIQRLKEDMDKFDPPVIDAYVYFLQHRFING